MMDAGFSFQETLQILETDKNASLFEEMRRKLEEGCSVSEFLTPLTEKSVRSYISGFVMYMDAGAALGAACAIVRTEKKERKKLISGCLYPCLLLAGMTAGIFLFASFVLPSMLGLMRSLDLSGSENYELLRTLIRTFSALLFVLCVTSVVFALWRLSPSNIDETYRFLCPRFKDSWLVMAASRDFTRFFLECVRRKVPTMQALRMLKQMKEKPLVALIAGELDESLMSGTSFEKAMASPYVESALARFIHLAAAAANVETMLEGYLAMSAKRTEAAIRRFSTAVQLFSYSLIGLVLIFVYSILMLPMTMLQQI